LGDAGFFEERGEAGTKHCFGGDQPARPRKCSQSHELRTENRVLLRAARPMPSRWPPLPENAKATGAWSALGAVPVIADRVKHHAARGQA
jgi:hypothetical protein